MSYQRPSDDREYGGGGGTGRGNYYDQSNDFEPSSNEPRNDRGQRRDDYNGGRRDDGNRYEGGRADERREESGRHGNDGYGGERRDDYGGRPNDGYGGRPEQRQEYGRNDEGGSYGGQQEQSYGGRDDRSHGGRQEQSHGSRPQEQQGGNFGYGTGGGQSSSGYDQEFGQAAEHAANNRPQESDLFSSAVSFLSGNKQSLQNERLDEDRVQQSHSQLYQGGGGNQQHDSQSLGAGAAMQALKMFQGGGNTGGSGSGSGSGGGGQAQMISLAMQEASKLFDKQSSQGNVTSGADKQSAITAAGKFAMQMYMKQQMGGGSGGSGGGASGLLSLAEKFLK